MHKLIITKPVHHKIREWCAQVPDKEWSGILFYTVEEGDIVSDNLVLKAQDIYVLDIGVSTYTEFEQTPDVLTYQDENDLLECYTGLVHSHDTMKTFFSGTDTSTLDKEGNNMLHFLSLIVNNAGDYCAKITYRKECNELTIPSFNGKSYPTDGFAKKVKYAAVEVVDEYMVSPYKNEVAERIIKINASKVNIPTVKELPDFGISNKAKFDFSKLYNEPTLFSNYDLEDEYYNNPDFDPQYTDVKTLSKETEKRNQEKAELFVNMILTLDLSGCVKATKYYVNNQMVTRWKKAFGESPYNLDHAAESLVSMISLSLEDENDELDIFDRMHGILSQYNNEIIDYIKNNL